MTYKEKDTLTNNRLPSLASRITRTGRGLSTGRYNSSRIWVAIYCLTLASGALGAGDPAAGQALSLPCSACHGLDGATGLDPTYPNLAGQNEKYLYRQMKLIQSNERPILLMTGQLLGKTDQDIEDLAAYYASLPGKTGQALGDDASVAKAEAIYRGGMLAKSVAACTACHAPTGGGNALAGFPALGGQPAPYLVTQLKAYREGERTTDEIFGGMMRDVAGALTDGEIAALADYLQGLH